MRRFENILSNLFLRGVIYIADGLIVAGSSLLAPIFAIFVEEIGGGIPEAGIAVAIYSFPMSEDHILTLCITSSMPIEM